MTSGFQNLCHAFMIKYLQQQLKQLLASQQTRKESRQNPAAGVLGGIIKGLKGKVDENANLRRSFTAQTHSELLESIFLKESSAEPSMPSPDDPIEELSIDDIEIDDDEHLSPPPASSSTSHMNKKTIVEDERAKLFEGSSVLACIVIDDGCGAPHWRQQSKGFNNIIV